MKSFAFLVILLLLLVGCQPKQNQNSTPSILEPIPDSTNISSDQIRPTKKKFVAIVNDLRIRDQPNKKGLVLGKMPYGQTAIDLGEVSDFKEKLNIRGQIKNDNWKKISTFDETTQQEVEGWVYGGCLIEKDTVWKKISPKIYERKIIRATNEELSTLLGMKILDTFFFDGTILLKELKEGKLIKDGKFSIKGVKENAEIVGSDFKVHLELSGAYKNDFLEGEIERNVYKLERQEITILNYENRTCTWSSFWVGDLDDSYTYKENNPKENTFKYIKQQWLNDENNPMN